MNLKQLLDNAPVHIKNEFINRKFKKNNFIIYPDEENRYLYALLKGKAEVYRQNYAGTMLSLHIYREYSCFGELEIFNKQIKTFAVKAKTDCEIIAIHKNSVYEWMQYDFNFTLYLIEQLTSKLTSVSDTLASLAFLSLKERVLCSIYTHYKIGDLESLTKKKLANEVCAPIRSLNRSIAQSTNEKLIKYKDKRFIIISLEKLKKYNEDYLL